MTGAKVTGADPGRSSGRAKDRFPALRNGEVTGLNWIVVDTKRKRSKMALKISAQRHN